MTEETLPNKTKRSLFRKIINVFIGFTAVIIFLLIIIIGFTQTITFRNLLRDKVVELVNAEINGKLNIEKIEGTILTSLFLRNISLQIDSDTLLYARNIEIKTSPLQLLLQKIYLRKILLSDVEIKLLQDSTGVWNFEKIAKPTPDDSTESSFQYFVQVNDLQLKNISMSQQTYAHTGSKLTYQTINYEDLRINNLFLSAQAFIDVKNSNYVLLLKELSFKPNLNRFALRNISGDFAVTKEFLSIKNFAFITDSSDVRLNARIDSLNIFDNANMEDFKNYPLSIDVDASSFNFDDLSSFLGSTEILKGNPSLELKANGKFGGFTIEKLAVDYRDTHFEIAGQVLNLNVPDKLFIKAKVSDTNISYKDVNALLPTLQLPEFAKLSVSDVNIEFEGEPINFKSKFAGNIENGNLRFECAMNLRRKIPTYDIKFETGNLDLSPVIGMITSINSAGSMAGRGFSPADINAQFKFDVVDSKFNHIPIENFSMKTIAADRKFDLSIEGNSEEMETLIIGDMVFDNDTIPTYSLLGSITKLDLATMMQDDKYKSDLNFYFSAEGRHINPDDIVGTFSFGVDSSRFRETDIKHSNIDIVFRKDSSYRKINLISDFVDFNIEGNFSVSDATELLLYESQTITSVISDKIQELNPLSVIKSDEIQDSIITDIPAIVDKDISFDYSFKFKDFKLIAALLDNDRFDLSGSGGGTISNQAPNFSISSKMDLDYFVLMEKDFTIYLSGIETEINFTRDNRYLSFDKLFGSASLNGKRFYSGGNIENISSDIIFNQSKLFFNVSADIQELISAEAAGLILMTPHEQKMLINNLSVDYKNSIWSNNSEIEILFNPEYFKISKCTLHNDTATVNIHGIIESSGKQNLVLDADHISGALLTNYLTGTPDPNFKAYSSFNLLINGEFHDPKIQSNIKVENLSYNNLKLGNLIGSVNYSDKHITTDVKFLDSTYNFNTPLLTLTGSIPIDLSFAEIENRFSENEQMLLKLQSKNFNLHSLGNLIPQIQDQSGLLIADVNIVGTLNNPYFSGHLALTDGYFRASANNLPYTCGLKLNFEKDGLLIDSLIVANAGGTRYGGQLKGFGGIIFDGFSIKDLALRLNGELAVFSEQSRAVSPFLYGDLVIGTDRDWQIGLRNDRLFFKGNVLLKQTDLVYTTSTATGTNTGSNFNVVFVVDSSKIDKEQILFQEILTAEQRLKKQEAERSEKPLDFDYEIGVKVDRTARLLFILSQAVNQKLMVEMQGDLKYESVNGQQRAQGAFELMSGSKLEFFKSFDAEGLIRFESDITNPYLDIVATYTNDYVNPRDVTATPQEVAVKISIKGPLEDLGRNLASNQENLSVYVGARNIQNNVRETRYDYADAFSFILFGKFKDDLTAQDRGQVAVQANAFENTATSFLGSVLSNFVNSAVGDLVNNIQISKAGDNTKFSLSGRIQNLRYSFGGTTEVYQNINKASIKVEYLFNPKFLIRLERKDPVVQSYVSDEKITEMAIKYRFEF